MKLRYLILIFILSVSIAQAETYTVDFKEQYKDWRGVTHDFNAQNLVRYPYFDQTDDNLYRYFNDTGKILVIPKTMDVDVGINRISPSMTFPKSTLASRMVNVNATIGYLVFPYTLSGGRDFADAHNIYFGRWHWDNGLTINDTNGSTLGQEYYDLRVVNDEIRLYFDKNEANKNLSGNITFRMNTWTIDNSTFWANQDCGEGFWSAYGGGSCATPLTASIHANLSGYWDMESTNGTTEFGINKYGRFPNSTIKGTFVGNGSGNLNYSASQLWGNSASLDGVNDYIDVDNDPILNISNYINFVALVKPQTSGTVTRIASRDDITTNRDWAFQKAVDARLTFYIWQGGVARNSGATTTTLLNNTWYYISGLNDGVSNISVYVNNTRYASSAVGGAMDTDNVKTVLGATSTGISNNFNGSIDEVIIVNTGVPIYSNSTYAPSWNMSLEANSSDSLHVVSAVKFNIYNTGTQNNTANISVKQHGTGIWTQIATNYSGDNTTWINGIWYHDTDFAVNSSGNGSSRSFVISMTYDETHIPYEVTGYVNNTLGAFVDGAKVTIDDATTLSRHTYLVDNTDLCNYNHSTFSCDGTRQANITYNADTNIQLMVFAHANSTSQTAEIIVNIDGVNVTYTSGRPLGGAEESYKQTVILIPKYANYTVYVFNYHHYEWREYPLVHGYYNLTSLYGVQPVLVQQVGYDNFSSSLNVSGNIGYNVTLSEKETVSEGTVIDYSLVGAMIGGLLAFVLLRKRKKDEDINIRSNK